MECNAFRKQVVRLQNIINMKKYVSGCMLITIAIFFDGCIKDTCKHANHYSWYEPLYKTSAEVRANIKSGPAQEIGQPGKMVVLGKYIFLNEIDKGIHVIDNTNPATPKNIAFIDLPGNIDLAIKGKTLYADLYTDLVTLDISNPLNVVKTSIVDGVFPQRYYGGFVLAGNTDRIIYDWIKHDTTIMEDCNPDSRVYMAVPGVYDLASMAMNRGSASMPVGTGGSLARFALIDNYLYTVGESDLSVFNVSNSQQPVFSNKLLVDWHVETIYPFENKLFIGSNNGMFMYNVSSTPENPSKIGEFTHARSCDPVIADDTYAYVTLHSGTTCLGYNNELDIVKLNRFTDAELVKTYNLTSPLGLSKDGNLLFICDGTDGMKVFNASNALNLQMVKLFSGMETYDVIAQNNIAIVVAKDGLYQYDYSNADNIHLVSKINIKN